MGARLEFTGEEAGGRCASVLTALGSRVSGETVSCTGVPTDGVPLTGDACRLFATRCCDMRLGQALMCTLALRCKQRLPCSAWAHAGPFQTAAAQQQSRADVSGHFRESAMHTCWLNTTNLSTLNPARAAARSANTHWSTLDCKAPQPRRSVGEPPEASACRCLDLHALHMQYTNSKFGQRGMDYLDFVGKVANFEAVAKNMRSSQPYRCAHACDQHVHAAGWPWRCPFHMFCPEGSLMLQVGWPACPANSIV